MCIGIVLLSVGCFGNSRVELSVSLSRPLNKLPTPLLQPPPSLISFYELRYKLLVMSLQYTDADKSVQSAVITALRQCSTSSCKLWRTDDRHLTRDSLQG